MLVASALAQVWPLCLKWIIDISIEHHDLRSLTWFTLIGIATALAAGLIGSVEGYWSGCVTEGVIRD
ncbi:MAG: hypothetical protein KGM44_02355, partial [bacterium]|nr:hypothetical protein [bacterium]